jgi:hypothetical protein
MNEAELVAIIIVGFPVCYLIGLIVMYLLMR